MTFDANAITTIQTVLQILKKRWPDYTALLSLYGSIFEAQAKTRAHVNVPLSKIPAEILKIKQSEQLPLITAADFKYDLYQTGRLFEELCRLTSACDPPLGAAARNTLAQCRTGRIEPAALFERMMDDDDDYFDALQTKYGIDKAALAFLTYNSLLPSIEAGVGQLAGYFESPDDWTKGYCPVCGSLPCMAVLEGEGQRSLICGFCRHRYPGRRLFCPFCETTDTDQLDYFYAEEENEYRVNTCRKCRRYLKTIDARKLTRPLFTPLEQIATLHLDVKARESGFTGAMMFDPLA